MPDLSTDRLSLRTFRPDDLEAVARICGDPEVMRYVGRSGKALAPEAAGALLTLFERSWRERPAGVLACELESGQLAGWCGFFPLDGGPETEIAYVLDRQHWGRGLATEAVRATVDWALDSGTLTRVVAVTWPDNLASQRVLEKAGLQHERDGTYYGRAMRYFARDKARR